MTRTAVPSTIPIRHATFQPYNFFVRGSAQFFHAKVTLTVYRKTPNPARKIALCSETGTDVTVFATRTPLRCAYQPRDDIVGDMRERRLSERAMIQQTVSLTLGNGGGVIRAVSVNLSAAGALVLCDRFIAPGSMIGSLLILPVEEGIGVQAWCSGKVVRVEPEVRDGKFAHRLRISERSKRATGLVRLGIRGGFYGPTPDFDQSSISP